MYNYTLLIASVVVSGYIGAIAGVAVVGFVYGMTYCVQVVSEGIFTEVAELKNFQIVATIVMFLETSIISVYLSLKSKGVI